MDIKKDIQKSSVAIDRERALGHTFGIGIIKMSDRLATALYLVTSFLSDSEPLKNRLRSLSLELVREVSHVRYGSVSSENKVFENLIANIGQTRSLLELGFISGLISEMNFTILKREYSSLHDKIEIKRVSRESRTDIVLGDDFFANSTNDLGLPLRGRSGNSDISALKAVSIGHSKGQNVPEMSDRNIEIGGMSLKIGNSKISALPIKDRSKTTSPILKKPAPPQTEKHIHTDETLEKQSRRARILKLIKDKREVTIKDISAHFSELSEKTIQRELVALTLEGTLNKFGERRWSRYSIA